MRFPVIGQDLCQKSSSVAIPPLPPTPSLLLVLPSCLPSYVRHTGYHCILLVSLEPTYLYILRARIKDVNHHTQTNIKAFVLLFILVGFLFCLVFLMMQSQGSSGQPAYPNL